MKPSFIESILGANWRTTLTAGLTALFAALYTYPDLLSGLIPPAWGKPAYGIIVIIHIVIFGAVSKDAKVSGNGANGNLNKVNTGDGSQKTILPAIIALLFIPTLFLGGCALLRKAQSNPTVRAAEVGAIERIEASDK